MDGMYQRRPRRQPTRPPAPLPAEMIQEFLDKPYGGFAGARLVPKHDPPPQLGPPLTFEPPPWFGVVAAPPLPEPARPSPAEMGAQALAQMKEAAGDQAEPRFPFGPRAICTPVRRPLIPEWPEEQRRAEQLARERAEQGILEEHPRQHPPPRRDVA